MKTYNYDSAFPIEPISYGADLLDTGRGLTKREYFAAMAMQGLATDNDLITTKSAELAVKLADALIDELNKRASDD